MNIVSPFLQQSAKSPKQIAFVEAERKVSYRQFQERIAKIATFLQQQQATNCCIAIALERGIDAASCIYGILSAGAIYLPLDIKNPATRLNFIIHDAQPKYIIGLGAAPSWLHTPEKWLDLTCLPDMTANFSLTEVDASSLAAILYTSGSTGNPKGVALSHQALLNFSRWAQQTFKINAQQRIASLAPFHFDLSIFDLFTSLATGASVYFIPAKLTLAPSRLTAWLSAEQITTWYTVPSILSFITLKGSLATTPLPKLKQLLFAGEVFPSAQLIKLANLLPQTDLYNLYGPTETNVCCYWQVERSQLDPDHSIPIGIPACQAKLSLHPDTAELLVQSPNNFSGYWQAGKLQPFTADSYPTGDKASRNKQGEYCYHGRLDRMLKCSGYRVEPAEIEQSINQLDGIEDCAVVGIKDSTSGQRPAAVVVLTQGADLATSIKPLRGQLASYMQPCKFIVVANLPVLSNGKTDYQSIHSLFNKP
jgi:amino acid adenylation domain-containing protein